jgi:hypothetical protein
MELFLLMGLAVLAYSFTVPSLWKADLLLLLMYLFELPSFFISRDRKHLRYGAENFYYGETPYYTMRKLCEAAEVRGDDIVYDLGSGRGKPVFFVCLRYGCRAVGFELIGTYVRIANRIKAVLRLDRATFNHQDLLTADLSGASVIFVHGSFFTEEVREGLFKKIETMSPGTRLVTVSVPIDHARLELFKTQTAALSWGREPIYIYRVRDMAQMSKAA